MGKKRVYVMNTAFRDGFQSCLGARVLVEDYLPAVAAAKDAGIDHFEFGGGAMFQSAFFYCNQNAFDVMDKFRATVGPDVNLQTLARGINVVGLDSQSSIFIELHAKLFKKHGTTTIRNFDALNDVNNLVYSGQMIKKYGLKHEICITMMALPPGCTGAHDPDFYMRILDEILAADVEFDSLCFKDASGTSVPAVVYETIKRARKKLGDKIPIRMHTHETAGTSVLTYKAALDAGADGIDLSMAPMSGGTCQPDIVTMWHALRDTEYDLGLNIEKVLEAEDVFKKCMEKYDLLPEDRLVEPLIPWSPMPGGALTTNTQMLRDNGLIDKYPQIFAKMGECVRKGGFGTSVTPVSQFYFQQAFNNFMFGDWKKIAEGYGKMVLGYFGRTPCPPDPEVVKIAQEQLNLPPTQEDPRLINDRDPKKSLEAAKKMLLDAGIQDLSEENLFIASTCGEKGILFLKGQAKVNIRLKKSKQEESKKEEPKKEFSQAKTTSNAYDVVVDGQKYHVVLEGDSAVVNGRKVTVQITQSTTSSSASPSQPSGKTHPISAALPGLILRVNVQEGDSVQEGQVILVLESMKMATEVKAPVTGKVAHILVKQGDHVKTGQVLAEIAV